MWYDPQKKALKYGVFKSVCDITKLHLHIVQNSYFSTYIII